MCPLIDQFWGPLKSEKSNLTAVPLLHLADMASRENTNIATPVTEDGVIAKEAAAADKSKRFRIRRRFREMVIRVGKHGAASSQGGNSIGFLDRLTDRLKMGDGLKMSDFGLGMS